MSLALYSILALLWWFPVAHSLTTMVAGKGGDPFQSLWRFVRLGEAVVQGTLTVAEEQGLRNLGPLPWLPFHFVFGEVAAYNIAWLGSAVLSGWCLYLLARLWGATRVSAFLAGILVMYSPYRLSQALGHFGAMQLWWIPAVLLALTLWLRSRKWLWALATGLLIVGTAWTEHQLFLSLTLFLAVFALCFFRQAVDHTRAHPWQVLACGVIVFIGAFLPFLSSLKQTSSPTSYFNRGQEQRERFSATGASLFTPPPFHLFRAGAEGYETDTSTVADHVHTLGMLLPFAVLCGIVAAHHRSGKHWALAIVAVLGVILALGPSITVVGKVIPMPGALVDALPIVSALRTLGRFIALPVLALPLLLALCWQTFSRLAPLRWMLPILLMVEVAPAPFFPHMRVDTTLLPELASSRDGLFVIPAYTNYRLASEHLYLSAYHHRPLLGNAALERILNPEDQKRFLATPVVRELLFLNVRDLPRPTFFNQDPTKIAPLAFAVHGIATILFYENPSGEVPYLSDAEQHSVRTFLRDTLGLSEISLGEGIYTYAVTRAAPQGNGILVLRGEGWKLLYRSDFLVRTEVAPKATVLLYAVRAQTEPITLNADIVSVGSARHVRVQEMGEEESQEIPFSGPLSIELPSLPRGWSSITLAIDGSGLVLENPHLGPREST